MITSGAVPQEVELSLLDTLTHPPVQRPHLRNWSRTFGCRPELLFYPANVEEVRTIVKEAVRQNRRVRAFGEGNSPSSSWCSNEVSPFLSQGLVGILTILAVVRIVEAYSSPFHRPYHKTRDLRSWPYERGGPTVAGETWLNVPFNWIYLGGIHWGESLNCMDFCVV